MSLKGSGLLRPDDEPERPQAIETETESYGKDIVFAWQAEERPWELSDSGNEEESDESDMSDAEAYDEESSTDGDDEGDDDEGTAGEHINC